MEVKGSNFTENKYLAHIFSQFVDVLSLTYNVYWKANTRAKKTYLL